MAQPHEGTFALGMSGPGMSPPSSPRLLSAGTQVRVPAPPSTCSGSYPLGPEASEGGNPSLPHERRPESKLLAPFSAWGHKLAIWGI